MNLMERETRLSAALDRAEEMLLPEGAVYIVENNDDDFSCFSSWKQMKAAAGKGVTRCMILTNDYCGNVYI